MKVFTDVAEVPEGFGPSIITIGKFDGVHIGHRAVVERLMSIAAVRRLIPVIITFDRHPLALLDPENAPKSLSGTEQKVELIAELGLMATVVLPFTHDLVAQSPEIFARDTLSEALGARVVIVGEDFRFGTNNMGDVGTLTELGSTLGFEVIVIPDVTAAGERRASSTWVRELLSAGKLDEAHRILGHNHTVRGEVVHGAKRGRELGFPTANLSPDSDGFVPADGVYSGYLVVDGERLPAAISVGNNPTFGGVPQQQVEAHVIEGPWLDLYGKQVTVEFVSRIRGMVAYTGVEPLVQQIRADVEEARHLLSLQHRR